MDYSEFRSIIRADLKRYTDVCHWRSLLSCYLLHPGFRFSCWFRVGHFCRAHPFFRFISKFVTLMILHQSRKTGIQVNPGATIGAGLYIPHYGGIVVNPQAVIGKNCYLSHNVLIGKVHAGKRAGVPVIGDDVFIGTGAVLLGSIKVGNNAAIGVNSVVINDLSHDVFAAGAPATKISCCGASGILGRSTRP